ncbi:MAG TPA: YjfB family protein [Phycisphaerae bacterium]|nr:YjfB family protein [Phycisphaerae bacterium]
MDLISGIASLSTALSTARLQNEVGIKVLKIAQGQQQVAADLVNAATETIVESLKQLGTNLDMTA